MTIEQEDLLLATAKATAAILTLLARERAQQWMTGERSRPPELDILDELDRATTIISWEKHR